MFFNFPYNTGRYTTGRQPINYGQTQSDGLHEARGLLRNPWPAMVPVLNMMRGNAGYASIYAVLPTPSPVIGLQNPFSISGFVKKSQG